MRWGCILAIAAVLIVAATASISVTDASQEDHGSVIDMESYSISYRLNGGYMDPYAPDGYVHGSYMPLPFPYRDGYLFAGWCTESALTNPIGGISSDLRGHVVLYAKWIEDTRVGTGWTMKVEGSYSNGETTVSGEVTSGYVYDDDGLLLLRTDNDILYQWADGGSEDRRSLASWIVRMTDGFRYVETDRRTGVALTVWEDQDGNTMWLRDMIVPVRIESRMSDGGTIVRTLTEEFRFTPRLGYTPVVESEYPITVKGVERTEIGKDVTLTAEGDDFKGWRLNGRLVSTDREFTFDHLTPCDRIEAVSDRRFTVVSNGTGIEDLEFGKSTVRDSDGNVVSGLGNLKTGHYEAVKGENGNVVTLRFVIEEQRTFALEWEFGGTGYSIEVPLLFSEMYADQYDHGYLARFFQKYQSHIEAFHAGDSETMRHIASELRRMGSDMDKRTYAEFVLRFVQSVPYLTDLESRAAEEYWKFPMETLWDGGGDCEDKAILYNTLMGISGYRVAFIMFKDHAMSAVTVDGVGETMVIDRYPFVMAETTWPQFSLGQTSEGHTPDDSIFSCRVECFDYRNTVRRGHRPMQVFANSSRENASAKPARNRRSP